MSTSPKHAAQRMPTIFVPHGGGPWPFVDVGIGDARERQALTAYLSSLLHNLPATPRAVLCISAHWEAAVPTVTTATHPPLLFDYSGFPAAAYALTWPAPGAPDVAARVGALLSAAGIKNAVDGARGFDHGAFVPLKLAMPAADIPTLQLSLQTGLDPQQHLAIGRALQPLRDDGVLIVGSGMTFHNMRAFGDPRAVPVAAAFDAWLQANATLPQAVRDAALAAWERAPSARLAHPREEHLLPLMVVAGAAGVERGTVDYSDGFMGVQLSAYRFGASAP